MPIHVRRHLSYFFLSSSHGCNQYQPDPLTTFNNTKDLETETKFQEGLLSKMSKVTDLMTRLDAFNVGADAARVGKFPAKTSVCWILIPAVERHLLFDEPMFTRDNALYEQSIAMPRLVTSMETKMAEVQTAYDSFVEARASLGDAPRTDPNPGNI